MKKKLSLFTIVYLSCVAFSIIAIAIFLLWLKGWVSDYNERIPETVSQKFFDSTFKNLDADRIIEMSGIKPCEFETNDDLKAHISKSFDNATFTSIATGNDDIKKYIVKSGEYKTAEFTLEKDGKSWAANSLELFLPEGSEQVFKVLSTDTLYINGKAVSKDYITSTEPHKSAEHLPEWVKAPEWIIYTVNGLVNSPEFSVVDRNGNFPQLFEENGILIENPLFDANEPDVIERILTGAKQYAICMQNDATKSSLFPYFEKGTDLYTRIMSVENMFVWDHNGYEFEDVETSEFFRYDDDTVSLRVSFIHILKMHGREDYRNPTDITYFARKIDGEYMIFSAYNN